MSIRKIVTNVLCKNLHMSIGMKSCDAMIEKFYSSVLPLRPDLPGSILIHVEPRRETHKGE